MALYFRLDGSVSEPVFFEWEGQLTVLTSAQYDETIGTLWSNILELQAAVDGGVAIIDDITVDDPVTPTLFTITLTDYRTFNIPLPVAAFNPVGPWTNNMALSRLDIVDAPDGNKYWVRVTHTTPASGEFDPDAQQGGEDLYAFAFRSDNALHWKDEFAALADYLVDDVIWHSEQGVWRVNIAHEVGAEFEPYSVDENDDRVYTQIAGPPFAPPVEIAASTYELTLEDVGRYLRCTNGVSCVINISAYVEWPVGAEVHVRQAGDGPVQFNEQDTMTINPQREGYDSTTAYKGATVTIKFVAADECDLIGPHGDELAS